MSKNYFIDLFKEQGYDINNVQKELEETNSFEPFVFEGVKMTFEADIVEVMDETYNVVGYFPGTDPESDTARINRLLEDVIREMPDQYLWVHRRFKTRPPGEPSPYD